MFAMTNLLLFTICIGSYLSLSDVVASDVTTLSPAKPDNGEKVRNESLTIEHVSSTINSITIRWNSTKNSSDVRIEAFNGQTQMTVVSSNLQPKANNSFTIPDLAVDTKYLVCVVRLVDGEKACDEYLTIPLIRFDTILVVLLTLAFVALLILAAILCWRCAIYQANASDKPEQDDRNDNGKVCNASPKTDDQQLIDEKEPLLTPADKTVTPAPDNQQSPTSLYLFLSGPALEGK